MAQKAEKMLPQILTEWLYNQCCHSILTSFPTIRMKNPYISLHNLKQKSTIIFSQGFLRCFKDPIRVSGIENRVPRIRENYHRILTIRKNRPLQVHTGQAHNQRGAIGQLPPRNFHKRIYLLGAATSYIILTPRKYQLVAALMPGT